MTDTTTTTTGAELDGTTADPGPLAFTLPAELAAASWAAVVAAVAPPRDRRPVLCGVHVTTGPLGLTLAATDTYAAHRVTLGRELDGVTLPFLPHAPSILPAWKATDVARLCKGAARVRFTAGEWNYSGGDNVGAPARCEALDASGAVVGSLAAPVPADPGMFPEYGRLFDAIGWPTDGERVGLSPAMFARTMTAADRFGGKDGGPVVVETMTPLKPARFTMTREDGATLAAVLMPRKLPTTADA
jgi:hypothetical protein